jgi:hypothetical protein
MQPEKAEKHGGSFHKGRHFSVFRAEYGAVSRAFYFPAFSFIVALQQPG